MDSIKGGIHTDQRGQLIHFNDFDLAPIKRFYAIKPADTNLIRAWQGHKLERKWFYCSKGAITLKAIEIDNWSNPSKTLEIKTFELNAENPLVVCLPKGCVNGFKAELPNSEIQVFSEFDIEQGKLDDHRFEADYWKW